MAGLSRGPRARRHARPPRALCGGRGAPAVRPGGRGRGRATRRRATGRRDALVAERARTLRISAATDLPGRPRTMPTAARRGSPCVAGRPRTPAMWWSTRRRMLLAPVSARHHLPKRELPHALTFVRRSGEPVEERHGHGYRLSFPDRNAAREAVCTAFTPSSSPPSGVSGFFQQARPIREPWHYPAQQDARRVISSRDSSDTPQCATARRARRVPTSPAMRLPPSLTTAAASSPRKLVAYDSSMAASPAQVATSPDLSRTADAPR